MATWQPWCCLTCMLQHVRVVTWMQFRLVLFKWVTLQFFIVVWNGLQYHSHLGITFVIAGHCDEIIRRTERKKQFVVSESTKVTKKRKREITIIHRRRQNFFRWGGNVGILFIIFILLTISVPSKIILHGANICFSEHDYFRAELVGLSMNCKHCELYNKNTVQFYQHTNKITFHPSSFLFACFSTALEYARMCESAREWHFNAQQLWWFWVFAHSVGTLLTIQCKCDAMQREHCWRCNANGRSLKALSFLHYKGNTLCYGKNHRKTLRWQR